jgi:hypothetical protein
MRMRPPAGLAFATSETFAGGLGGGLLGFNWQVGNLVLGLEADVDGSGRSATGALAIVGCGAACTRDAHIDPARQSIRNRARTPWLRGQSCQ